MAKLDLTKYGITGTTEIVHNPDYETLFQDEMEGYTDDYVSELDCQALGFTERPHIALETKLDLTDWIPDGFGTADCIMIGGDKLLVADFKYGKGVKVAAEDNPQMQIYALGAWTDGTDNCTAISGSFGGDGWTLVGCGDFDGDGKDSVVMTFNNGQIFYTADLNGNIALMGSLNWSGWEVCAIGDFAGDGKDDMVLFHKASGSMVMLADGKVDNYTTVGLLNAKDWFVVGAGDYNGDRRDDLLVRQYSTGMLGYYSGGDTTQWNVLGYGVSMDWTVIA